MKVFTWLLLLKIFVHTHPLEPNDKDKTVNLALETVLEFNQQDNSADIQFLDHVQNFITRVRTVIDKNKMSRRDFKPGRVETLTDFLIELIAILNTYQDHDFQDVFDILDDEIRKYHYRGCKFYELTENYDIRKLMATKLDLIRGQSVAFIKTNINQLAQILKDEKYEKYSKDLIDYINSLYRQDAKDKFKKVLTELEEFNKAKVKKNTADLVKVVRDGIRSVIFDHYTDLNPNARRELKYKIESFWRQYKQSPPIATKTLNESKVDNGKPEVKADVKTVRLSPNVPAPDTKNVEEKKKIEPNTLEVRYTVAKEEFSKNELEKEEDSNNDEDVSEHSENDSKRIELKQSDFKKPNMMRGVNKEGNTDDPMKVWEARYTKLDDGTLINEFNADATQPTKKAHSAQRTTRKSSKVGRTFSSDEAISEDVGSVEDNSLEFNAEEMETTHQRYLTLYPEIITNEPKTADKPTVVHRSRTSELPKVITLWEEENTGGIPKYILNQMTTKSRHKSKHKKHKTTRKPKKHKKKHRKHKRKEHKTKLRSKKRRPAAIFSENNGYIDVRSTAMEFYEYKKMLGPVRTIKTPESTTKISTIHTIQPYTKRTKPTTTTTAPLFGKRYQVLPLSSLRDFRKSAQPTPMSDEGLSIEQFKIDRMPTSLRKSNMNKTSSIVIDENVMKRIKNLEREIKDVKSKIGEAKAKELKLWKDKEKKYDIKDRKSRKTDIRTKISKPAPEDVKKNKYKLRADKEPAYKDKKAVKDKPVVDKNNVSVTENKYISVPQETRTTERTKATESTKTNVPNIVVSNNNYDVEANRIDDGKFKLVNADKHIEFGRFAPGAGGGGSGGHHGFHNYDEIDEWKGAFRPKPKVGLAKTTISSTKQTTTTQTEMTTQSTTVKTTEATTVPTITTKLEIFIPLTMPQTTTTTTTSKHIDSDMKMDEKIDMQLSLDDINLNIKTPENLSQLVSQFAESNSINDTKKRENIQREISFMLKKNDISVPTDKLAPMGDTRDYRDFSYSPVSFKIRKELAFSTPSLLHPNFDNNTLEAGLLLSDPFRNIDEELEFLKI